MKKKQKMFVIIITGFLLISIGVIQYKQNNINVNDITKEARSGSIK